MDNLSYAKGEGGIIVLNLQETGKNIKEIREVKGLSQEKAAEKANISGNRWQEIEYGRENMTVDTLRRIAAGTRSIPHNTRDIKTTRRRDPVDVDPDMAPDRMEKGWD